MRKLALGLVLGLVISGAAAAASAPIVQDTSFRDASGHRVQQLRVDIDAPVAQVWAAFATSDGFRTWAAPVAQVDLRNDGMIEASYSMRARIGDADNIRNLIVAYVPERLMVLQNVNAPANAPFDRELFKTIRTVIEFQDLGNGRTRIIQTGVGYGDGAAYENLYTHFHSGNAQAFQMLAQRFITGPIDWPAMIARAEAAMQKPGATQ